MGSLPPIFTAWTPFPALVTFFALVALSPPSCSYIHCNSLCGFQFPAWISPPLPCTSITCMGSNSCMGDLFAIRALSPPPCTYIHCMGFNLMYGSPPLPCTYIYCILYGVQFPVWVPTTLLYLYLLHTAWVQFTAWVPHHEYFLCPLRGFHSLCG